MIIPDYDADAERILRVIIHGKFSLDPKPHLIAALRHIDAEAEKRGHAKGLREAADLSQAPGLPYGPAALKRVFERRAEEVERA